jgi:[ribosomal protein S5]-alanine N-acetyltransferase
MKSGMSARLDYEPIRAAHADVLFDKLAEPQIYEYIDETPPDSIVNLRGRFDKLSTGRSPDGTELWLNWALRKRLDGAFIGYVQATVNADKTATIAYVVFPNSWNLGFGTEAVGWLLTTLASEYDVEEAYAIVDRRNKRSLSLLNRLGFSMCSDRRPALETDAVHRLDLRR